MPREMARLAKYATLSESQELLHALQLKNVERHHRSQDGGDPSPLVIL